MWPLVEPNLCSYQLIQEKDTVDLREGEAPAPRRMFLNSIESQQDQLDLEVFPYGEGSMHSCVPTRSDKNDFEQGLLEKLTL